MTFGKWIDRLREIVQQRAEGVTLIQTQGDADKAAAVEELKRLKESGSRGVRCLLLTVEQTPDGPATKATEVEIDGLIDSLDEKG